jgi:hypothetical protein
MTVAPDELQERFLAGLRERVAWQAEVAARLRAEAAAAPRPHDVLDLEVLHRLVDEAGGPRRAEWRAFLAELDILGDRQGRLPPQLERLVRVVLGELLP